MRSPSVQPNLVRLEQDEWLGEEEKILHLGFVRMSPVNKNSEGLGLRVKEIFSVIGLKKLQNVFSGVVKIS